MQESVLDLLSDFCTAPASELWFPSVHRTRLYQSASAAVRYCRCRSVGSATVRLCTPLKPRHISIFKFQSLETLPVKLTKTHNRKIRINFVLVIFFIFYFFRDSFNGKILLGTLYYQI